MRRALVLAAFLALGCAPGRPLPTPLAVRQGPFVVDVRTTATVEPLDSQALALGPELWDSDLTMLAAEGAVVKKGEVVARAISRHVVEDLQGRRDDLAGEEGTLARVRANAPVKRQEVAQELVDKQQAWRTKALEHQTARRGGAPDEQAAARADARVADLDLDADMLGAKQDLYGRGVLARQELETARRDHDLALLERRRARLALAQLAPGAKAERVEGARLAEGMARAAYERARAGAPTKQQLAALEEAKSRVRLRGLKAQVADLEAKVAGTTLRAPDAGVVIYPRIWGREKAYVGMQVWPGLVFLQVARLDAVKLRGSVSEAEIAKVHAGQRVEITADAFPGRVFPGQVTAVGKLAKEDDSRRGESTSSAKFFDLEVRPEGPAPGLRPAMRVGVRVLAEQLAVATSVPMEALFGPAEAHYIWLEDPHGPRKQAVTVAAEAADWVALAAPLPPGSRVYLLDPTAGPPEVHGP